MRLIKTILYSYIAGGEDMSQEHCTKNILNLVGSQKKKLRGELPILTCTSAKSTKSAWKRPEGRNLKPNGIGFTFKFLEFENEIQNFPCIKNI